MMFTCWCAKNRKDGEESNLDILNKKGTSKIMVAFAAEEQKLGLREVDFC